MPRIILPMLLAVAGISFAKPVMPLLPLPAGGTDARPTAATSFHNLSEMWMTVSNVGLYGNPWGGFSMEWPGGEGSTYMYLSSIWASAFGAVSQGGVPDAYVSSSYTSLTDFEFWATEGCPMTKLTPGPTALEESSWGEDDWYAGNENPIGVRTFQRAYSWSTPGYDQFLVNDITVTHLSEHGNPGVPLDAFCFSVMADLDIASADPSPHPNIDDMVFYDGHEIWCNDPDATFDYEFDDGTKASEADNYIYQRNPDASWADPEDDIYYFYNYPGSEGIVDADANSDGVSDHFTVLFKVAGGDTIYATEPNTGLQLFAEGVPPSYWMHTVGDTAFAVVPRNLSYMWDGDNPASSTDDSGEPTYSPPCNGFAGWRLLDFWIRKADGTIERPIDVFGYPIPLSHSWWQYQYTPDTDQIGYDYQWGQNQDLSGLHSGPAYLADWIGDPSAPDAFQPDNPGPFPIVQDNPLALDYQPFDYVFLLTMGPVDLTDGDSLHIVGGFVIGRGLADLRQQADNLLDAYYRDGGWGVPDIPPVPTLFYEPGDGTVDLIWSDDAESYDPFGGYHLYRSVFNTTDWQLIADIGAGTYAYSDASVTRGFPYYYVLCACDAETGVESPKTNYKQALDGTPIPVVPGWASDADWTETISVVPNPYRGSAEWELPYSDRIAFTHLPPICDIRIYTLGGDHIVTLQHRSFGGDSGEEYWDLKNGEGRLVASGLYVYVVQTSDDQAIGKFAIIR
jgi:hypothetical protein